jgi:hypothetical protein
MLPVTRLALVIAIAVSLILVAIILAQPVKSMGDAEKVLRSYPMGENNGRVSPGPGTVKGYTTQTQDAVDLVNGNKQTEEMILRLMDGLAKDGRADPRWLAVARTHFEQGYMALNRAIFKPERIRLPNE